MWETWVQSWRYCSQSGMSEEQHPTQLDIAPPRKLRDFIFDGGKWATPVVLRIQFQLCTQELLLKVLGKVH